MSALLAEILTDAPVLDERSAARRTLRLQVSASTSAASTSAVIHNLSENGLQLETAIALQVGEALHVDLPHAGTTTALVVWKRGKLVGCEFTSPVSKATVSAALLLAPAQTITPPAVRPANKLDSEFEEQLWQTGQPSSRVVVTLSLLLMILVTATFIVALATFPFSV